MQVTALDLSGAALNYAVAIAEGVNPSLIKYDGFGSLISVYFEESNGDYRSYNCRSYITPLNEAGMRIIERECISVIHWDTDGPMKWRATVWPEGGYIAANCYGDTFLIAAMRAYVWAKLGDYVEIPDVFMENTNARI